MRFLSFLDEKRSVAYEKAIYKNVQYAVGACYAP